jgi:hypothetical protein
MHKHISPAILFDKTEALLIAEPLNCSFRQDTDLLYKNSPNDPDCSQPVLELNPDQDNHEKIAEKPTVE